MNPTTEPARIVPAGTPVTMVMSVTSDGALMIPCGIPWDGAEARSASVAPDTVAWDEQGMVAFDRMGEGMWRDGRDKDGLAFVSLVLDSDAPARADGSLEGGEAHVVGLEVLLARDLDIDAQAALLAALIGRYPATLSLIGLEEAKARVPALARRRRDYRLMRVGVIAITPFMFLIACVWYPYELARAGWARLGARLRGTGRDDS